MPHQPPEPGDSNGHGLSFLSGLFVGGLVGAVTGLLLAPQPGEQTRTMLENKGIELRDRVTQSAEDARTRAETLVDETKARVDALQQRSREFLEEGKHRIEKSAEAAIHAAQETWGEGGEKPAPS